MKLYSVVCWSDVEPQLFGPFADDAERLTHAREYRAEIGDDYGCSFRLNIADDGTPAVSVFTGDDIEPDEPYVCAVCGGSHAAGECPPSQYRYCIAIDHVEYCGDFDGSESGTLWRANQQLEKLRPADVAKASIRIQQWIDGKLVSTSPPMDVVTLTDRLLSL